MTVRRFDFTEGNILRQMVAYSLPIFLTNVLQASYQFVDSLWVGNLLGSNALASVSVSGTIIFTILSFIIGMNGATLTILAQRKGAGDERGLQESLNAFVVVFALLAISLGLVGYVLSPYILTWIGTPDTIHKLATQYLQVNALGIVFLFGYNFIGTVLRALGDSRTPIRFVLAAVILNTVLDPLFIAGFNMGVVGAAAATILSQGLSFVYALIYTKQTGKIPFTKPHRPDKQYAVAIFRLGIPAGLQMMLISGGMMAVISIVNSFGEDVVAGFGAAQRMDSLIMLPILTLGSAVTSMAGQNIGAGKWERVSDVTRSGIRLIMSVSAIMAVVVYIFAPTMLGWFVETPASIRFGADYLRTVCLFYPFLGINFVLNGVIRGAGAMLAVLVLNFISFWVLRYPLSALFSRWLGESGIAYGMGVSFLLSAALVMLYYRFGRWQQVRITGSRQ
ncbi:putative MATE family efflux protein [Aneurinibacillus soli]|uniref:Multidrug resistance protein NorM n=1 Tax=Aneurinibacillus soli TaxID=1500254 RepID=A0A0U4WN26_9BACL|nr:MATE family efflux transporter [Aneurinibacillus soli]PYE61859.1 putative MATE family efflux protein [Aneurinibacillus soli]BAU29675.1 Multidrug resistance protein NorM [Aneurinibacillus soli]